MRSVQWVRQAASGESWASRCPSLAQAKVGTEASGNPRVKPDPALSFLRTQNSELNTLAFQESLRQAEKYKLGIPPRPLLGLLFAVQSQGETLGRAARFQSRSLELQLSGRSTELGGQCARVPTLTRPLAAGWLTSASP